MKKKSAILIVCLLFFSVGALIIFIFAQASGKDDDSSQESKAQIENEEFVKFKALQEKLPSKPEEVSLVAVGDIMLSRDVARKMKKNGLDYPFLKTKDYLKTGDLVFGNLESPITAGREINTYEMVFRADPGVENTLKEAGFSVLSLANNHMPNFGNQGLGDTFFYLQEAGIEYAGAGENKDRAYSPVYLESKGLRLAFLAYNDDDVVPSSYQADGSHPGTAFMDLEKMTQSVKEAKEKADFVIVSIHSGFEYTVEPNQSQKDFAHVAIDAGAEMVIGHHPHVVQKAEIYNGKYIFYSFGNFIFDQMWSQETKEGLMIKASFNKKGVKKIEFLPILIEDFSQPRILENQSADKILNRLDLDFNEMRMFDWDQEKNDFAENSRKAIYNQKIFPSSKVVKLEKADLNEDSIEENYSLENGNLKISQDSQTIWESPNNWWVDNFVLADSTGDGIVDLNLSVWKAGNFGQAKPFWTEENDQSTKNHFFVLGFKEGKINPIWQSSNLEKPNCEFLFEDINNDHQQELIVIEGEYSDDYQCEGKYVAVWKWNEWGFVNEWRSNEGEFKNLKVEIMNEKKYIVVDNIGS